MVMLFKMSLDGDGDERRRSGRTYVFNARAVLRSMRA